MRALVAKPVLKWAGGKTQLLPQLVKLLPPEHAELHYIEPFFGGGALFFHLQPARATLNDVNRDLINFYGVLRSYVSGLLEDLDWLQTSHNRSDADSFYYDVREIWNAYVCGQPPPHKKQHAILDKLYDKETTAAAVFYYLNKTCFNGIYRVNRDGAFNVPAGKYAKPRKLYVEADMLAAAEALRKSKAVLMHRDFSRVLHLPRSTPRAFVYLDPPYAPLSKTSNFTNYAQGGFDEGAQHDLAQRVRHLTSMKHRVMISNSDAPLIRTLYKGFNIHTVQARRAINSKASRRGAINELVITNY